ncbi:MAG: hypothetical protein HKN09_07120 [Saprospiraceae bacterium]|nr:hypothetical protein [Saprospiraceae bacterium]
MSFKVKDIWKAYQIMTSHCQYFDLVRSDLEYLNKDQRLLYDIDSYDVNTILFKNNIYLHNSPQHYKSIRSLWTQFIEDSSKSDNITLTISPLAIFETVANIKRNVARLESDTTFKYLKSKGFDKEIKELTDKIISTQQGNHSIPWKDVSSDLKRVWLISKRVLNLLEGMNDDEESGLRKLLTLIATSRIQYLDDYLKAENISMRESDFDINKAKKFDFDRGMNYLKQNRWSTKNQEFFSSVDMLRMASAANLHNRLRTKGVRNHIVSNGQHTLTAWNQSWNGKMESAPFRPSQSVGYLGRVIDYTRHNTKEAIEEIREAFQHTKRIKRYLEKHQEIIDIKSRKKSVKDNQNIEVQISNRLNLQLLDWQSAYMDLYSPKEKIDLFDNLPQVNLNEIQRLKRLTENELSRKEISGEIKTATKNLIDEYSEIFDFEKLPLFGPIGEEYINLQKWLNG